MDEVELTELDAVKVGKPIMVEVDYTYVSIEIQLGDRKRIEFRQEFDPNDVLGIDVLHALVQTVENHHGAGW